MLFYLFIGFVFSQKQEQENNYKALKFKNFSLKEGLSQSSVLTILQDRKGFLWFGTRDGLNKYDGNVFKVFRHYSQDNTTLSDSFIKTLHEDANGNLWVGTMDGLNKFNIETNAFEHYDIETQKKRIGSLDKLNAFARETMGQLRETIWAVGNKEIFLSELILRLKQQCNQAKELGISNYIFENSVLSDFPLTPIQTINFYRIIQEGINNITKYAKADKVTLVSSEKNGFIKIGKYRYDAQSVTFLIEDAYNALAGNGGYQNGGYQNGGYQNGGYQNGGYQSGGYQNGGYQNGGYQNSGIGSFGNNSNHCPSNILAQGQVYQY